MEVFPPVLEVAVLHEKMAERDQERGQLEIKVTELSATVSSTLASYTFLEQALATETTKCGSHTVINSAVKKVLNVEATADTTVFFTIL